MLAGPQPFVCAASVHCNVAGSAAPIQRGQLEHILLLEAERGAIQPPAPAVVIRVWGERKQVHSLFRYRYALHLQVSNAPVVQSSDGPCGRLIGSLSIQGCSPGPRVWNQCDVIETLTGSHFNTCLLCQIFRAS